MNGARHRFALGLTCFFMICMTVVYPFLLYTPNAFVSRWREWYIETAMGTMTHQWLATWFIPHSIIEDRRNGFIRRSLSWIGNSLRRFYGKIPPT